MIIINTFAYNDKSWNQKLLDDNNYMANIDVLFVIHNFICFSFALFSIECDAVSRKNNYQHQHHHYLQFAQKSRVFHY